MKAKIVAAARQVLLKRCHKEHRKIFAANFYERLQFVQCFSLISPVKFKVRLLLA
jgi:hypothetical protein